MKAIGKTPYIREGCVVTEEEFNRTAKKMIRRKKRKSCKAVYSHQGYSESKPGKSISMSIHPSQIPMMNETIKRHGIKGVYYDPTKRDNCVITSREGRKKWIPIFGAMTNNHNLHDMDGGYNDG